MSRSHGSMRTASRPPVTSKGGVRSRESLRINLVVPHLIGSAQSGMGALATLYARRRPGDAGASGIMVDHARFSVGAAGLR